MSEEAALARKVSYYNYLVSFIAGFTIRQPYNWSISERDLGYL
jgi:hypothetical protein